MKQETFQYAKGKCDFRIIIIDDNAAIHHDFIKILTSSEVSGQQDLDQLSSKLFGQSNENLMLPHFEINTASQGQEGVELIRKALEDKRPYALAFVDIRMPPGWDGIETIKHIWELDPDIQVVICTAYSDYSWEETVTQLGKKDNLLILKKPFDHVAVRQLACALTKKWQLLQEAHQYTSMLKQEVEDRTVSLQTTLSLVKATLESSNDGILVVNKEGEIVNYNQKLMAMWQLPRKIVDDKNALKLYEVMQDQLINANEFIAWMKKSQEDVSAATMCIVKFHDGKIFECFSQPQILNDKTVGRVYNFHDVTSRAKLEQELEYQAKHDALTGLPNRILLLDSLHKVIKQSEMNHSMFALIFLDLDRFKLINDSLSHAVGDELLQVTTKRLLTEMRNEDILARLGGDEFVIIIANLTSPEQALAKAQKLLRVFQQPFAIAGREVVVTASLGVCLYPENGTTADVLLRNADSAMYRAKELGSNNFQFYSKELNAHTLEKLEKETELRQAITNNELVVCYQPQLDLTLDKIVAVEALIRWNHPTKGLLLPIDFIPLAEETGLILQMGEWILRTACQQSKSWQDEGLPPLRVAVNVTAQQFKQSNLVDIVKQVLTETQLTPELLEIELTENVIISSAEVSKTIIELKKLGVNIAIDDFGTGYSSLSYLKKIPLDRLKIDGSFLQQINSKNDDDVILRAVITMAKSLNLEVIAEGVETEKQLNFLKSNDCGEGQGFYFSTALTEIELKKLLKNPDKEKLIRNISG